MNNFDDYDDNIKQENWIQEPDTNGGGLSITEFDSFPPIPDEPTLIYCKNRLWFAAPGYVRWDLLNGFSSYFGSPSE